MTRLKTRNVFLDTEVFIGSRFRYNGPSLSALASHAAKGEVRVFLTDVTVEEVKAHIREAVQESLQAHQSFAAKAEILRNSASANVKTALTRLKKSTLVDELIGQFEAFLKEAKATNLKAGDMKAGPVFAAYFGQKPPFGRGKKKSEFPDAFAVAALGAWCSKESSELYIVSGDADMRGACNENGPLHSMPRLVNFLDALASDLQEERTAFVRARIVQFKSEIIKLVTKDFPDRGFIITDVADLHSNVENIRVTSVEFVDDDFEVIEVTPDSATVTAALCIRYEADLNYGNEETASYDHEDGYFFFDTVKRTVEREEYYDVQITAILDACDPSFFDLDEVYLDAPDTIKIEANEDVGPAYR